MSAQEGINVFVDILKIITSWPVVVFAIFFILKTQIRDFLPEITKLLSQRITKATIAGSSFEFAAAENQAIKDTIEEHSKTNPEDVPEFLANLIKKSVTSRPLPRENLPLLGKSILWVDDNPDNNIFEVNLLKHLGSRVLQVKTTDEALKARSKGKFDLVISDIHRIENGEEKPKAGYEFLAKNEKLEPYIPTVFYTGNASRVDPIASAPASGVTDNSRDLAEMVLEIISQGR